MDLKWTGAEIALVIGAMAALITAVGSLTVSIGTLIVSLRNSRKIEQVHLATNSMQDKLIAATKGEAFAAGQESQRVAHKAGATESQ